MISARREPSFAGAEKTLLTISFFGPIGAILGVVMIRHKSKKWSYLWKLGVILILSAVTWITLSKNVQN